MRDHLRRFQLDKKSQKARVKQVLKEEQRKRQPSRAAVLNCKRKLRHLSKEAAQAHIDILRAKGSKEEYVIYPCDVCGGLHVGRPKKVQP